MKLRGKLILSCAALAAVATTAFSTTYAWYITNSTVSASGVTAGTTSSGSDTLQISLDAVDWKSSVTVGVDVESLIPVQYGATGNVADGTYPTWNPTANAASGSSATAATGAYCEFNLFFRNPNGQTAVDATDTAPAVEAAKVYLKQLTAAHVANTTLPNEKLLTGVGVLASPTAAAVKAKNTYKMDLLRTLNIEIVKKEITVAADAFVGANAVDTVKLANNESGVTSAVYGLDNYAGATGFTDDFDANVTNAHTYYNDFKGLTGTTNAIPTTDKLASATQLNLASAQTTAAASTLIGTAAGQTYLKTTWRIFINGWDLACFDAIKGQSIQFGMTFDTFSA